jgi:hypothetical protein
VDIMKASPRILSVATAVAVAITAGCGSSPGPEDAGAIAVEASVQLVEGPYVCPGIASFSIIPANVKVLESTQLAIQTVGPTPSIVAWSVSPDSAGVFSDPASMAPTFSCTGLGRVVVTVKVGIFVPNLGNVCEGVSSTMYSGAIDCQRP